VSALDLLTTGLFDYAGMFPPAGLPFEDTLKNSSTFPSALRRPTLVGADIVLTFKDLPLASDFALATAGFTEGRPVRICVLGTPDLDAAGLKAQINALTTFNKERQDAARPARIISFELKIKPAAIDAAAPLLQVVRAGLAPAGIRIFIEPDCPSRDLIGDAAALLTEVDSLNEGHETQVGFKLRGSGPTAVNNAALSVLLVEIVRRGLPFKATAGLHHPIIERDRHENKLGFLNLICALRLLQVLGPDTLAGDEIVSLLDESDPSQFRFTHGLGWRNRRIDASALEQAHRDQPFSIGSCSLTEPDADLSRLFPTA
jgi:hypothetical protein